jgi:uncharacterized protein (DUF1330 family)
MHAARSAAKASGPHYTAAMDPIASGACIVGRIRIVDAVRWPAYRDAVPATLAPFGGVLVTRGHDAKALAGVSTETDMVVIRFPSTEAIDAWYASAAYQALIPLRDAAADVTIVRYAL